MASVVGTCLCRASLAEECNNVTEKNKNTKLPQEQQPISRWKRLGILLVQPRAPEMVIWPFTALAFS